MARLASRGAEGLLAIVHYLPANPLTCVTVDLATAFQRRIEHKRYPCNSLQYYFLISLLWMCPPGLALVEGIAASRKC